MIWFITFVSYYLLFTLVYLILLQDDGDRLLYSNITYIPHAYSFSAHRSDHSYPSLTTLPNDPVYRLRRYQPMAAQLIKYQVLHYLMADRLHHIRNVRIYLGF